MKQLKQGQKVRIIMSGVAIYTTVKELRGGMFGFTSNNQAAFESLASLEKMRVDGAVGLCGTFAGHQVQLDIL